MSFLDRFKIQPKYKSTDADVRLEAVREFNAASAPDDERAANVALAREDADARVRRAARRRGSRTSSRPGRHRPSTTPTSRVRADTRRAAGGSGRRRRKRLGGRDARAGRRCAIAKQIGGGRQVVAGRRRPHRGRGPPDRRQDPELGRAPRVRSARRAAGGRARCRIRPSSSTIATKTDHKDAGIGALDKRRPRWPGSTATPSRASPIAPQNKSVGKRAPRDGPGDRRGGSGPEGGALEQHQQRLAPRSPCRRAR